MFLEGSFHRDNYVGEKSSERHSGAMSRGYCQGAIFFGIISWEQSSRWHYPGANFPQGQLSGRNFSRGKLSFGTIFWGTIILGLIFWVVIIWGLIFLGDNCPGTFLISNYIREIVVFFQAYTFVIVLITCSLEKHCLFNYHCLESLCC